MAEKALLTDLNAGGVARLMNLPAPQAAGDAAPRSYVDGRTPKITVGTTAPASPAVGDLWVDTQ